ncbi:hypothetical protein BDV40DRAFT_18019 [Aspergillus tamarii]|uniref:Uncharacterized protein n=1 Tax=Aspergillus tamarii TaxID=41984 RepID=A0A5N6V8R4_ASPTM|nr:hypothetical protein BDV40DRAFT_18019 [Aspergillus tamarii]
MMSRWLLNYTPPAVVIRLLTTNGLIAYISSWVLYLSGASSDPRLLLPAWISITTTLTFLYHATQNRAMIKRETAAALLVVSVASFYLSSLLLGNYGTGLLPYFFACGWQMIELGRASCD